MDMAAKRSAELYSKILEAYQNHPADHETVARITGVTSATAKQTWEKGWPSYPWAEPICNQVVSVNVAARDKIQERRRKDDQELIQRADLILTSSKADAAESRAEEGVMIRRTRQTGMMALNAMAQLLPGLMHLGDACNDALKDMAYSGEVAPFMVISMMEKFASTYGKIVAANKSAMEMERLWLGEPTSILSMQMDEIETMPIEQLVREFETFKQNLLRSKERGHLVLVEGGLSDENVK
jgi:hypothetical protein